MQWKAEFLWASLNINAYYFIISFSLWINVNPIRTNRIELVLILPDCLDSFDSVQNCAYKTCLFSIMHDFKWGKVGRRRWINKFVAAWPDVLQYKAALFTCKMISGSTERLGLSSKMHQVFRSCFMTKTQGWHLHFLAQLKSVFSYYLLIFYSFFNQQWEPKVFLPPQM